MNTLKDTFTVLIVLVLVFGFVGCATPQVSMPNNSMEVPNITEVTPNYTEPNLTPEVEEKSQVPVEELCITLEDLPKEKLGILIKELDQTRPKTKEDVDEEAMALGWNGGCIGVFFEDIISSSEGDVLLPVLYNSISKYSQENIGEIITKKEELEENQKLFTAPQIGDESIGYYFTYQIDENIATSYTIEFIKNDIWVLVSFDYLGDVDMSNLVLYYAKKIEEKI